VFSGAFVLSTWDQLRRDGRSGGDFGRGEDLTKVENSWEEASV
jgi:hypothetical protein